MNCQHETAEWARIRGTCLIVTYCVGSPLWSSVQSSWLQKGDALCFLWGTDWIYICYVEESRPPLWSSGQSSWLQIQRSRFYSRRYQIFWEVVGLERGPLSVVSTIEELLGRKSSGCSLENREYGGRDPSRWPRVTFYPQTLELTSPASAGRSVGIVRSPTEATEFICTHTHTHTYVCIYIYTCIYTYVHVRLNVPLFQG
jgi:hypothetical protein